MEVEIDDFKGVARDIKPYQLDPSVWSQAVNVRIIEEGVERMKGWAQIFGTPPVAPHFTIPLSTAAQVFWLYVSLTKGYVYDGATHTNITRTSGGDYNAASSQDWNATILGGVPIFNNGVDIPQFWAAPTLLTKFANLTNWPSTLRAKVIRAFGSYLMAFNVTKSGTNFPHLVKWSHEVSDPGTVPSSWDEANPAVDAGEYDLPDVNSGILLDALPLGSNMFIYKEGSVWVARFVGGRFIFNFDPFINTSGLLAARCVGVTGDGLRQCAVMQDDIIVHNGNTPESILDHRMRRTLFNEIDPQTYGTSFIFPNPSYKEMWFCYPTSGSQTPNKALIWNYGNNEITEADGITFVNGAIGNLEDTTSETWADGSDAWDTDTGPWADLQRRRVVLCSPVNTKFYNLDSGLTRDGVAFTSVVQREGLAIVGRKRSGEWIVDHSVLKMMRRLWPKVVGGPIRIRIAFQEYVDGTITWSPYLPFDPTTMMSVDYECSGRAVGLEVSTVSSVSWRLDGYKLEFMLAGKF